MALWSEFKQKFEGIRDQLEDQAEKSLESVKEKIDQLGNRFSRLERLKDEAEEAYQHALACFEGREPPESTAHFNHGLAHLGAVMNSDPGDLLGKHREGLRPPVDRMGEIYGFGKFEQLDPEWLEALLVWALKKNHKHPFETNPAIVKVAGKLKIAITGDWGTGQYGSGLSPAVQISECIRFQIKPDHLIHLGDVYYAGTSHEEKKRCLKFWPLQGTNKSFTLNSNHEMYDGADGYFKVLLADPLFAAQQSTSYFALQNDDWIIVGLDSAYFSNAEKLYLDGALDSAHQLPFLKKQAEQAESQKKGLVLMTHHNGLSGDGSSTETLWDQVMSVVPSGLEPFYWYWGHVHIGAVYPKKGNVQPRCVGHSAIPWGEASALENNPNVVWHESRKNPTSPPKVMNGFLTLELDGSSLTETFYDQTGTVSWPT